MKKDQKQFIFRLHTLFVFIVLVGFVLITNLFYIQIQNGQSFREQADGQYTIATYNAFERGSIFFEQPDGTRISAAGQKTGYKISVNPSIFKSDRGEFVEVLSRYLDVDSETINKQLDRTTRTYIEIAQQVPKDKGESLKKELGSSIQLHVDKWRVYPLKGSGSHLLGFLGFKGDDYAGRYGLERSYEETLQRKDTSLYTNFFARIFHSVDTLVDSEKVQEGDIVATIDPQIQIYFETELKEIKDKWDSEAVGGIIMNPKNGEIVALGAFPNFDNNDFSKMSLETLKNPLVENVYEMGSIIKPLVVAMAIDTEDIDPETMEYYDPGFVKVGPHTIKNFDEKGRGWVKVQDILSQSLNTGMVHIASQVTKNNFRKYFDLYGFTGKTGIDLPNEATNISSNLKSNRNIEFANMSFGQGIAVSPISMVRALSALANNGFAVLPHVVKKIEYTNGFSKRIDGLENQTTVLKPETAGEISRLLVNVFDSYQGGNLKIPGYSIAAKTGTAQIPDPKGGYYGDRNLHSFFGYFPAYDPQFVVFLYTVHPKGIKYASQTLIEPFRDTAKYVINYYNIPPDR